MGEISFNNGVTLKARETSVSLLKAQTLCKMIRKDVCGMSMKKMGEYCGLSVQAISSWESGKANNCNYLFFYYDICLTAEWKKMFLDIIFNSDGKNVDVTVYKNKKTKSSSCKYVISECEENKQPVFNVKTVEQIGV